MDMDIQELQNLFEKLRALNESQPKAPESWGDAADGEFRWQCETCQAPTRPSFDLEREAWTCSTCRKSQDAPIFSWMSEKNHGEWIPVQRDVRLRDAENAARHAYNRGIGCLLSSIDPRVYGQAKEELAHAYEVLSVISDGLSHGASASCSAKRLLMYVGSVSDFAVYWGNLWVKACLAERDFVSAENLLSEMAEGEESQFSTQFARATSLHGTLYIGKATIALLHTRDVKAALTWAERAKRGCAGVPGVIEKALAIAKVANEAKRLVERNDMDEDEAIVEAIEKTRKKLGGQDLQKLLTVGGA